MRLLWFGYGKWKWWKIRLPSKWHEIAKQKWTKLSLFYLHSYLIVLPWNFNFCQAVHFISNSPASLGWSWEAMFAGWNVHSTGLSRPHPQCHLTCLETAQGPQPAQGVTPGWRMCSGDLQEGCLGQSQMPMCVWLYLYEMPTVGRSIRHKSIRGPSMGILLLARVSFCGHGSHCSGGYFNIVNVRKTC